jgi:HEAT repeat protein
MTGDEPSSSAQLTMLRRGLASPDPEVRASALSRIRSSRPADRPSDEGTHGAELEEVVTEALGDPEPGVRAAAVRALARLGARRSLRPLMRAAAEDPAPAVRREAVAALARLATSPSA